MERRIIFIAFITLITACTKTSVPVPAVGDSHEIIVSIADSQFGTKCTLDSNKTTFSPGDQIKVISQYGSTKGAASYKYVKTNIEDGEKFLFQKIKGQNDIDTNHIVAAFYPASWYKSYDEYDDGPYLTASFPIEQEYQESGTQTITAPMAFFGALSGGTLEFTNISSLLQIGIKCSAEPENEIKVQTIKVSSTSCSVASDYMFSDNLNVYGPSYPYMMKKTVSLTGCASAGAISTQVKYYYIILPPISDALNIENSIFTVGVSFVNHPDVTKTFTVTKDKNVLCMNRILKFDPIIINP